MNMDWLDIVLLTIAGVGIVTYFWLRLNYPRQKEVKVEVRPPKPGGSGGTIYYSVAGFFKDRCNAMAGLEDLQLKEKKAKLEYERAENSRLEYWDKYQTTRLECENFVTRDIFYEFMQEQSSLNCQYAKADYDKAAEISTARRLEYEKACLIRLEYEKTVIKQSTKG
jgi:hypothetical protein